METIVALATSPIKSALQVIRLSGTDVFNIASKISDVSLEKLALKGIHVGKIFNDKELVDQVVFLSYVEPKSYTGENCLEIMCHGSPLIANKIIELFIANGARMATNGEFTSRAFLNGKLDLVQAEAVNDIINATTIESHKLAAYSLNGETSSLLKPLITMLLDLAANIEVNIDYPEYQDIEVVNRERIKKECYEHHLTIRNLIKEGREGLIIKNGVNVVIYGKPNVGKSSLLNALLNEDKAIVTSIAGTTRDVVEGEINLDGVVLHLFDTAGIRETSDEIENIGVKKALNTLNNADIIIHVVDVNDEDKIPEEYQNKTIIRVINKSDLITNINNDGNIYISALKKDIEPLKQRIKEELGINNDAFNHPSFSNKRELALLEASDKALLKAIEDAEYNLPIDLITVSINEAILSLKEIFGEKASLDMTEEIFKRFCVGK